MSVLCLARQVRPQPLRRPAGAWCLPSCAAPSPGLGRAAALAYRLGRHSCTAVALSRCSIHRRTSPRSGVPLQAGRLSGLTRGFATAPATTRDVFDSFEELVTTDDGRRELERVRSMYRQMDHEAEEQAKEVCAWGVQLPPPRARHVRPVHAVQVPKINFANQFKDLDPDVAKAFQAAQDGAATSPARTLLCVAGSSGRPAPAGMKFEPYDFAKDRQEIRDLFGPLIKQAEEMATHAEKRLVEIRKEMKRLEEEKVCTPPVELLSILP